MTGVAWENFILPFRDWFQSRKFMDLGTTFDEGIFSQTMRKSVFGIVTIDLEYEGMWMPEGFSIKVTETISDSPAVIFQAETSDGKRTAVDEVLQDLKNAQRERYEVPSVEPETVEKIAEAYGDTLQKYGGDRSARGSEENTAFQRLQRNKGSCLVRAIVSRLDKDGYSWSVRLDHQETVESRRCGVYDDGSAIQGSSVLEDSIPEAIGRFEVPKELAKPGT
jgi:hypothetical protein